MRLKGFEIENKSWGALQKFEKNSLIIGFILYVLLPLIKEHSQSSTIIGQIILPMFEGLANALFFLGVVAFLHILHEKENKKGIDRF